MERPIAAPLLPILRDSDTFNDLERPVKRTKFHKQSTSFAGFTFILNSFGNALYINPANICAERQTKFYKADFFTNTLNMTP